MKASLVDWVATSLVIIGALNWGLVGLFNFDLVSAIFGNMTPISRGIYSLVGLSGLWSIYALSKCCKHKTDATPPVN